jgi:F-type H+-transporting ATPase subunit b
MLLLAFAEETIQLFPDGTIFIHIALILLMIWILNRTFFRPINRVLTARENAKGGKGSEADNILRDASEKEAAYNKEMLDARSQGYELIESEHAAAVQAREEKLGTAKHEVAERLASEKSELERQVADARDAVEQQADEMAEKIASNILKA